MTKLPNFRYLLLLSNLYFVSTFLLSWQRFAYGIQDTETVKQTIDLRMKQFEAILLSSQELFPTVFRSKRFKSKAQNLVTENPSIWHCSTCTDSNPKNPFLHPAISHFNEDIEDVEETSQGRSLEVTQVQNDSTTTTGFAELPMEPYYNQIELNETELIKLLGKNEIEYLVEDFYNTQAYALIPVPLDTPGVKPETNIEAGSQESIVSPEIVGKDYIIEEEKVIDDVQSTSVLPALAAENSVDEESEPTTEPITEPTVLTSPQVESFVTTTNMPPKVEDAVEDSQEVVPVVEDGIIPVIHESDSTVDKVEEVKEVLMDQSKNNISLIQELEEKIESQREALQVIGNTLEEIKDEVIVLESIQNDAAEDSTAARSPVRQRNSLQESKVVPALPQWILMSFFFAGIVCSGLFTFAVYSMYQYWMSYPTRFISWLERRIIKLFEEKKFDQVIEELNKHLPEVKKLKGPNHIDTCAFKHYKARAYIALSDGKPALALLEEVLSAYLPFGEDVYLAQVYEDIGISQHNLDEFGEALLNLQTALKIFTEEYTCESGDWKRKAADSSPIDGSIVESNPPLAIPESRESEPGLSFDYSTLSSPEIVMVDGPFTPYVKYNDNNQQTANANFTDNIYPTDKQISQSLESAFVSQVDLNAAIKELEDLLGDENDKGPNSAHEGLGNIKTFKDLQEVAHVDIARVCKELGDVYNDIENFEEALVFYKNALDILKKLMPEDSPQVECLCTLVQTTRSKLSKVKKANEENPKSSPVSIAYFASYQTKSEDFLIPIK